VEGGFQRGDDELIHRSVIGRRRKKQEGRKCLFPGVSVREKEDERRGEKE